MLLYFSRVAGESTNKFQVAFKVFYIFQFADLH